MTKQQIKDALEICAIVPQEGCNSCPYIKYFNCRFMLMKDAAFAITGKESQPEGNQQEIIDYKRTIKVLLDRIEQLEGKL